jgi:hypothetical protein
MFIYSLARTVTEARPRADPAPVAGERDLEDLDLKHVAGQGALDEDRPVSSGSTARGRIRATRADPPDRRASGPAAGRPHRRQPSWSGARCRPSRPTGRAAPRRRDILPRRCSRAAAGGHDRAASLPSVSDAASEPEIQVLARRAGMRPGGSERLALPAWSDPPAQPAQAVQVCQVSWLASSHSWTTSPTSRPSRSTLAIRPPMVSLSILNARIAS